MTIGLCLYVLGWVIFLIPNNLIGGGVTGISSIIQYATGIKIGYSYFVLNIGLLIAALFTLGGSFGGKTVYAIVFASVFMNVGQTIIPSQIIQTLSLDNGKLMCTIMGAIMAGTGMGLTITQGGSTGGTDIIALIVNKYRNVSPGRMIFIMDVVIILSSLVIPSYSVNELGESVLMPIEEKVTTVVYGFILVFLVSTVLDLVISGSRQSVQVFVYSRNHKIIADALVNDLHRGVTVLDGIGWFSKDPMKVVTVVARKTDLQTILKFINLTDPDAFVSVSSVTAVYGKGFDAIKTSKKKIKK